MYSWENLYFAYLTSIFFWCLRDLYGSISKWLLLFIEFWFILTFMGLFQVIKSNEPLKLFFFFQLKVFLWNEAVEVIKATEAVEAVEAVEVIEAI